MSKLLAQYETSPSLALAIRIRAYDRKHSMAACMLSPSEHVTLRKVMVATV